MTDSAPAFFVQLSLPETDVARKAYAFAKRATPELEPRNIRRVDDLALVSNTATLTGGTPDAKPVISTTTEILRRQPHGGWLHILDDPFVG